MGFDLGVGRKIGTLLNLTSLLQHEERSGQHYICMQVIANFRPFPLKTLGKEKRFHILHQNMPPQARRPYKHPVKRALGNNKSSLLQNLHYRIHNYLSTRAEIGVRKH